MPLHPVSRVGFLGVVRTLRVVGSREGDTASELAAVLELTAAGQDQLALPRLEALCRDDPDAADLQWARARCLFFVNRQVDALAAVDRALMLDPGLAAGGRDLVMEIYASGRSGSAMLLFQRLAGGEVEAAQRWALKARHAPRIAFAVVLLALVPFSGVPAVMPAFAAWILTFEMLWILANRRFRGLEEIDRLLLGDVIESAARSGMFKIERRDAVAMAALGAGVLAIGLVPTLLGADIDGGVVVGASAIGLLLVSAGALAFRRDVIRRRLSDRIITDDSPWGVNRAPDWSEPTEDEQQAMERYMRTDVLPGLLDLRRDANAAQLVDHIDTSQLDDKTRRRLAIALGRTAAQLTAVEGQRDAALRCVGRAHLLDPDDPELTRFAARLGRVAARQRMPVAPVALVVGLVALGSLFVVPLLSLFTVVVCGIPLAVIAVHQARHPLTFPPGISDAMARFPARRDHRTQAWAAVMVPAVSLTVSTVLSAPRATPLVVGPALIAIIAARHFIPRRIA